MVNQSKMNLLFFFGVLIPALVTVGLFVVFCYCWHRIHIRNEILYKKHDPHKIKQLQKMGKNYEPPSPPSPPFTPKLFLPESLTQNNNNDNKHKETDNYEESPEPTEGLENPTIYRTNHDDLNQIQCNVDNSCVHVARNNSDIRTISQASEDSDDSGFRSSRSGHYLHSASSSSTNPQENCASNSLHTLQENDSIPLFKPIKIHPNENRRKQMASHIQRNSSIHKNARARHAITTSQHYRNGPTESHCNNVNSIYAVSSSHRQISPVHTTYQGLSSGRSCNNMQYASKSINDVNGGHLHSIDSHTGPLSCAGYFGTRSCNDNCSEPSHSLHIKSYHGDRLFSEPHSIGYDSAKNSIENMNSQENCIHENVHINTNTFYSYNNQTSVQGHNPFKSHIPGYSISSLTHIKPIQPDLRQYKHGSELQTIAIGSQQLAVTQAIVDKSYIDELGDPSLYSVV